MLDLSSRLAPLCSAAVSIKGMSFALPALRAWPGQLSMMLPSASLTMLRSNPAQICRRSRHQEATSNRLMLRSWLGVACVHACRSHDIANCNADLGSTDLTKANPTHSCDDTSDLVVCHSVAQVSTKSIPAAICLPRSR